MKYLAALMLGWWLLSAPLDKHGRPNVKAPLAQWQAVVEMSTQPQCQAVAHDPEGAWVTTTSHWTNTTAA